MGDRIDELIAGVDFPGSRPLRRQVIAQEVKEAREEAANGWDYKPLWKSVDGVKTEFFSIGDLAHALGRKPVTVRSWEDKGWLPGSGYRTKPPKAEQVPGKAVKGRRLYTRRQIMVVVAAAEECGVLGANLRNADWKKFRQQVYTGWKKTP